MKRRFLSTGLGFLFAASIGLYASRRVSVRVSPAVLWDIPAFQMEGITVAGEQSLSNKDLLGRPWVANFIYTTCAGPCPVMSIKMEALQRVLGQDVRLVSFTVDPDLDAPDVLRQYARRYHADPQRWVFVRGRKEDLYKLVFEGFKLGIAENHPAPIGYRVVHGTQFVLVDARGRVRGVYDSNSESFFERLVKDAKYVAGERA